MVELKRINDNEYIADFFEHGISIKIRRYFYKNDFLNYEVRVPSSYMGRVRGIFGNFDGDRAFEFFERGSDDEIPYTVGTRPDNVVYTPLLSCKICDIV